MSAVIGMYAGEFGKGEMVLDFGIGAGTLQVVNTEYNSQREVITDKTKKAAFTQKLGFEVGVYDFSEVSSLGFGVNINNSCAASYNSVVMGSYDYTYTSTTRRKANRNRWETYETLGHHRQGTGIASAKSSIDELNVMFKLAYHHKLVDNLDTYIAAGFGVASSMTSYSDYTDTKGFTEMSKPFDPDYSGSHQINYYYNDLDHVVWQNSAAAAKFAIAAYIGARYYFGEHWGATMELGINSLSLKKEANNFSILNLGVCYKF